MKRLLTLILCLPFVCLSGGCGSDSKEDPKDYFMRLSVGQKLVNNPSGSFTVTVTSNTNWNISPQDSWLKPERTNGEGEMTVRISFEANPEEGKEREGTVMFTGDNVNPVYLTVKQSDLTFTNPIFDMPDPWIIKVGDLYYACKAGSGNAINISVSDKLSVITGTKAVWRCPSDAGGVKVWNSTHVWAPELHYIDGRWYIYYTAGRPKSESNGSYRMQRSGVLRAKTDDPFGEWEDMGLLYTGDNYSPGIQATAANTIYAIDLSVFKLNGQLYAVWSGQPSQEDGHQRLYIAKMSDPWTISSQRVEISRADKSWEMVTSSRINEGPAFLHNEEKGKFFIVYSANGSWTKNYRLGWLQIADTDDPMNPANWVKSDNEVFYRCDETTSVDGVNGVGHCCFTLSPDGTEDWIVYHTKDRNSTEWDTRSTFIQKFTWNEDGTPNFGTPVGRGEPLELPSGETR